MIPIGSIEQHGPNGLLGTDAICAESIAWRVGESCGALVGPTLSLTVAQFNLGFAGTITVRAEVMMQVIQDYIRSLARHGFTHFYFLNGHGANIGVANAAFQDLYLARSLQVSPTTPALRCRLRSWWEYDKTNQLRGQLFGDFEGMHATPSEVALTQALYPDSAHPATMAAPRPLSSAEFRDFGGDKHFDAHVHRQNHPDGRVGSDPGLASATLGEQLLETVVPEATADFMKFAAG